MYDLDELFQSYTGVKPDSKASDITLLLQFFISIADEISNRDLLTVSRVNSETVLAGKYPVKSSKDNLARAFEQLRKGHASSLFAKISVGDSSFAYSWESAYSNGLSQNDFDADLVESIFDLFPSDMDDIEIFGQMLAASLINDCIDMSIKTSSINSKNKAFKSLTNGTPSSLVSTRDYFRRLINYDGFPSENFSYE
jgi:hypothetical protein